MVTSASPWFITPSLVHFNFLGFVEYLLDRGTDKDVDVIHSKYDTVKAAVTNPSALAILGTERMLDLKTYQRQGPFYIQGQTEIALEEDM